MDCDSCGKPITGNEQNKEGLHYGCYLKSISFSGSNTLIDKNSVETKRGDEMTGGETIARR